MKKMSAAIFVLFLFALLAGCAGAPPSPMPPLHSAAENGDIKTMKELLDGGAKINETVSGYWTPLILAARNCRLEAVKLLLDRGADIKDQDNSGSTALHAAASYGCDKVVKLLIDRGADINARYVSKSYVGGKFYGEECRTPLSVAANRGHSSAVRLLIENGADTYEAIVCFNKDKKNAVDWGTSDTDKEVKEYNSAIQLIEMAAKSVRETRTQIAVNKETLLPVVRSDIDELPASRIKQNKNAYAIVIGIENYRQKLPKADFATSDARLMSAYLAKVMGYPEENIVTLTNEHATKSDFEKYFEKWLSNVAEKDSTIFIYFSGHGAPNAKTGDAYLVPYDGDPSFIAETGYSLKRMYDALGKLPAKEIVVVLDSCFSGAGGRSVIAKGARPLVMNLQGNMALSKNMTVLSASSGDQTSSTYNEKGHGLFTYFLLKGFKNEDVVKPDGSITMDDLFAYIKPQVERIARKQFNNEQTPQLMGADRN